MAFKLQSLKKRAEFVRLRNGRYFAAPGLVLQAGKDPLRPPKSPELSSGKMADSPPRFGFTATKKLGNAVIRNRIKRRLREAVRQIAPQKARDGYEYVLIGRKSTLKRPFSSLLRDLTIAFDKVHAKRKTYKSTKGDRARGNRSPGQDGKNRNSHQPRGTEQ